LEEIPFAKIKKIKEMINDRYLACAKIIGARKTNGPQHSKEDK
jgi:hypothetical protein